MFKKYKQLVIGILIGCFLCSFMPISAAVEQFILTKADYKVLVNGQEYNDAQLPTLQYNGNTYIPLRNVANILGVKLNWNETENQAEIGTSKVSSATTAVMPTDHDSDQIKFYKQDDISFANDNGTIYISFKSAQSLVSTKNSYYRLYENRPAFARLMKGSKPNSTNQNDPIILDEIPVDYFTQGTEGGYVYIDYTYFQNTILPMVLETKE